MRRSIPLRQAGLNGSSAFGSAEDGYVLGKPIQAATGRVVGSDTVSNPSLIALGNRGVRRRQDIGPMKVAAWSQWEQTSGI